VKKTKVWASLYQDIPIVRVAAEKETSVMNIQTKVAGVTDRFNADNYNSITMANLNEEKEARGDGADFVNHQQAIDKAKNENLKMENDSDKVDPEQANREKNRGHKTDVSVKKTGGGKQVSPGT
jgi:hypothetical protein